MVAYVLALNPQILGSTGGTCDPQSLCNVEDYKQYGEACLFAGDNESTLDCLSKLRMDLTTATATTALISCFIMGWFANLPLALAPGMGACCPLLGKSMNLRKLAVLHCCMEFFALGLVCVSRSDGVGLPPFVSSPCRH